MAEQVVAEYKLDVDQAVKGLDKLQAETKQLDKDLDKAGKDGTKALDNVGKEAGTLSSGLKKLGGVIAAAFAVDRLISFGKEAVGLAAKAEGISRAFQKLNNPTLLADLRKATRGTVSDLELMQKAVQANNFKLPLDQLATLFKFATDRAIETGESVDYLVESIVLGISRKSIPILDNLGISSVQIQDEMKKTGDFAKAAFNIVEQSMREAGDVADTTAVKMAQLNVILENTKVILGKALIGEVSNLTIEFEGLSNQIENLVGSTPDISAWEKVLSFGLRSLTTGFRIVGSVAERTLLIVNGVKDGLVELAENAKIEAFRLSLSGDELERFNELGRTAQLIMIRRNGSAEDYADFTDDATRATQLFNKALVDLDGQATEPYVRSLNKLNEELKEIDKEFKDTEIGSQRWIELIGISEKKTQELTKALLKAQARLVMFQQAQRGFDPFAADNNIDSLFDIDELLSETKEIADSYIEETERATNIADKLWEAHFDKLMQETDDFNKKRKKDIEDEEKFQEMQRDMNQQFFNATLSSWQTLTYAISELSRAQYDEQQRGLENLLDKGIISQEEYERRRASLAREQFKKDKEAKLIQASINTALGVTNAIATAPNIILGLVLAAAAAAAGAAEIAVIASQPVPKFKDGGLVKEHGLLKGRSHAQGGIAVEAEGNEYFMPTQPTLKNYGLLEAMRKGIEEQYIMKHYVPQMMDASIFKGMNDIGNSAHLNGLTSGFKDHNLIAAIDRDRQSTTRVLGLIYQELKTNKKRDRYA